MSARRPWNNIPPTAPAPKPLTQLTRTQSAARLEVLTDAIDALWQQARLDGGPAYECLGRMRVAQYHLRQELRKRDTTAPMPPEVALALASQEAR